MMPRDLPSNTKHRSPWESSERATTSGEQCPCGSSVEEIGPDGARSEAGCTGTWNDTHLAWNCLRPRRSEREHSTARTSPQFVNSRHAVVSAADLQSMQIPATRWAIEGLLPEGLALIVGKPKAGKSWLVLEIALAMASGGVALGLWPAERGDVLYLSLEDSLGRLKRRLGMRLSNSPWPPRLDLATDCERLDEGGAETIERWLADRSTPSLVVVDTFAKVRPRRVRNANLYDEDYEHMALLKEIADRHHACIVIVHHTRKTLSDDPFDLVSGTNAIAGAADWIGILLATGAVPGVDAKLHIAGRDIESRALALTFNPENGAWRATSEWSQGTMTGHGSTVRNALTSGPKSLKELAMSTGIEYRTLDTTVRRLVRSGELRRAERGTCALP